jgi:hypothetical protein
MKERAVDRYSIEELIEASSLGTADARRHRHNTSPAVVQQILALLPVSGNEYFELGNAADLRPPGSNGGQTYVTSQTARLDQKVGLPGSDVGGDSEAIDEAYRQGDGSSYLESIFAFVGRPVPPALCDWEDDIDRWCDEYRAVFGRCSIVEVNLKSSVYLFDLCHERVLLAYGVSMRPPQARDRNRQRRFPDVNVGIEARLGDDAFPNDRGHFLSHASGGELDINLFPQRRELNRGWSDQGKTFRRIEHYVAKRPGTFHAHRACYDDDTWTPAILEYRVLIDDTTWWIETFANK